MHSSENLKDQNSEISSPTPADKRRDSDRARQLELEIQAFVELLLDIYEYRHRRSKAAPSNQALDPPGPGLTIK